MKKLLLLAAFAVAGITGSANANTSAVKNLKSFKAIAGVCYNYVYDKDGKIIGRVVVPCPDVIEP